MSRDFLNWTNIGLGRFKNKILLRIFLSLACCLLLITPRVSHAVSTYFCASDAGIQLTDGKESRIYDRFTVQLDNQTLQIKEPTFTLDDGRTITPDPYFLKVTNDSEPLQASNSSFVFSLFKGRFVKTLAIMGIGQVITGTCEKF